MNQLYMMLLIDTNTLNDDYPTTLDDLTNTESGNTDKGGPFIDEVPSVKIFDGCTARTGAEFELE